MSRQPGGEGDHEDAGGNLDGVLGRRRELKERHGHHEDEEREPLPARRHPERELAEGEPGPGREDAREVVAREDRKVEKPSGEEPYRLWEVGERPVVESRHLTEGELPRPDETVR